jgi:NADPH:quinone reductase-like Zn-dependent oxidoreductase
MLAALCSKSGLPGVIKISNVEKPVPKPNEILVKVFASSVTRGDVKLRKIPRSVLIPLGLLFGFKAMKITGVEFAGEVEEIGNRVIHFNKGDKVFGTTTGLKFGGNAEYVCVPEKRKSGVILKIPDNISYPEAAVIPVGCMTALHFLRKGKIEKSNKVLIYGASGSVGSYAVQIAKYFGAEVTGVCSTNNLELVKSIGADKVIDYLKDDFTSINIEYDIIFDAVGKITKSKCRKILNKNGYFLSVKFPSSEKEEYMRLLNRIISEGKIKPVIDRHYNLEQIVEGHSYVEEGHKKGNVVIDIKDYE